MSGQRRDTPRPEAAFGGWFQVGVGVAGLGLMLLIATGYYWWLLLGAGDSAGVLWTTAGLLLGVPAVVGIVAAVGLWRRRRWGFWLVVVELGILLLTGVGDTTAQTSALVQNVLVCAGIVIAIVGFFRTRPTR